MPEPRRHPLFSLARQTLPFAAVVAVMSAVLAMLGTSPARAHPHIWVSYRTSVVYENGAVIGFRQSWTFDEYYTVMAIEGLDTNKDGKYTREELAELAKVNVEALKEFSYFTFPRLKGQDLAVAAPADYWLEHAPKAVAAAAEPAEPKAAGPAVLPRRGGDPITAAAAKPSHELTLHFMLPLAKPVLAEADGLTFSMGDPSFFIAFEPMPGTPVTLAGAPKGCRVASAAPNAPEANPSKPGDLMSAQPSDVSVNIVSAAPWQVTCSPAG